MLVAPYLISNTTCNFLLVTSLLLTNSFAENEVKSLEVTTHKLKSFLNITRAEAQVLKAAVYF